MTDSVLEQMYLSSLKFLVPQTPKETYATIVSEAVKLVGAQWGSVLLDIDGELKRVYSSHSLLYKIKQRKRGFLYKAFKTGKPGILKASEISKIHPEIKKLKVESDIIIPLSYRRKSIGILAVLTRKKRILTNEEFKTLVLFGSMASLAIRKTQLFYEAKQALEWRDLFISMAAHELRTPVTTIYGYAQFLKGYKNQKKSIKSFWIDSIYSECTRLTFLIKDLLEISRIQKGELNYIFKECDLKKIISRVLDNFKFNVPQREIEIKDTIKGGNAYLIGDFDRLMQVFINILDNASKFSPSNKKIYLILKENSANYVVEIKDLGKGISKEEISKVFKEYYKGVGSAHEGLGLGLFLSKGIVKQHHGQIKIQSKLGKGTLVEIKLPKVKL